jgi:hypothetical protein
MTTEKGKKLNARELLLMPETEWPKLSADLTDKEKKTLANKLAAMTLAAGKLANYLGAAVNVAVVGA